MPIRQHAVKSPGRDFAVRTPAGDALSALVIQIFRLNGLLTAAGDELARPAGQSTARWQVLAAVERAPLPVARIARALGLARQSVQRVADVLEGEKLVAYHDNPEHLRAKLLTLTTRGRTALAVIQQAQRVWADRLGVEIGAADLRSTGAVLDRLLAALQQRG
jgi:DNA-binding MarR family transcriptional regulator